MKSISLSSTQNSHARQRINSSVMGRLEQPLLLWFAARMPAGISPDHMTVLGLIGSLIVGAGYVLSNLSPAYLWLASFGYILHWFGDSLDGTLARFRGVERPTYGLFVDHSVDALSATLSFLGLGLSPYVRFDVGCLVLITFLLMQFMIVLKFNVDGVFQLSYGPVGPTETRLIGIAMNTFAYFWGIEKFHLFGVTLTLFDLLCLALTGIGYIVFVAVTFSQAKTLREREERL
jgi:phosphatidylglycerophosphate synthase